MPPRQPEMPLMAATHPRLLKLRSALAGGDRRSLAGSERIRRRLEAEPALAGELAQLTEDPDWLVALRALDLLEKLAYAHPERVAPYRHVFIGPLADAPQWELRLQVVRALPRLHWSPAEHTRVIEILLRDAEHPRPFVRAWAVDGLVQCAQRDPSLLPRALT